MPEGSRPPQGKDTEQQGPDQHRQRRPSAKIRWSPGEPSRHPSIACEEVVFRPATAIGRSVRPPPDTDGRTAATASRIRPRNGHHNQHHVACHQVSYFVRPPSGFPASKMLGQRLFRNSPPPERQTWFINPSPWRRFRRHGRFLRRPGVTTEHRWSLTTTAAGCHEGRLSRKDQTAKSDGVAPPPRGTATPAWLARARAWLAGARRAARPDYGTTLDLAKPWPANAPCAAPKSKPGS